MHFRRQEFANSLYFSLLAGNSAGEGLARDCALRHIFNDLRWFPVQVQSDYAGLRTQCAAWLETFNRGARDNYRDFLQKNFPLRLQELDQELGFRELTGGFDLKKVEESTPTKLVALVQERIGENDLLVAEARFEPTIPRKSGRLSCNRERRRRNAISDQL